MSSPQQQQMMMPNAQQAPNFASIYTQGGVPGKEPDITRWTIIYPNYCDAKKTIQLGRRISQEKACDDPCCQEIAEVCRYFKLDHAIEHYKSYPRDWLNRGRVRVLMKNEDGTPVNAEVPNKKKLLERCGELIPKSAIRAQRHAAYNAQVTAQVEAQQAATKTSGPGSNKKKKKKGKR